MAAAGFVVVLVVLGTSSVSKQLLGEAAHLGEATPPVVGTSADIASRCPWLESAIQDGQPASVLAQMVLDRMTVSEKLGEVVLNSSGPYENVNAGVPRLCIPSLAVQDGPQGVGYGARHVTQLPSPLGVAASFNTSIALSYGQVEGAESLAKGFDTVQGPTLNIDRVPESGRTYEGYGEDPLLVSAMGVANIEGIQTTGSMAMAKEFAVYSQETDRGVLDNQVSERAVQELYLPPFKAAVTQAHVSTVMCAYPKLNGTFECQQPQFLGLLYQWGFDGFIRSDLGSVHDPVAALSAGTDLIKPQNADILTGLVHQGQLPIAAVNAAVSRVLTQMFAHGVIGRDETGSPAAIVDTPAHRAVALHAAESSAVLLKDDDSVLPLPSGRTRLAVIGADASTDPVTSGLGSSKVLAPFTSTPLSAIRQRAGAGTTVTYSDGGSTTEDLPPIPTALLRPDSGVGHGLTLTLSRTGSVSGPLAIKAVEPTADLTISPHPLSSGPPPLASTAPIDQATNSPLADNGILTLGHLRRTQSSVVLPAGWSNMTAVWTGTLTPPRSGLYVLGLQGSGGATLTLDGVPAVSDPLRHVNGRWSQSMHLTGGHHYRVLLHWQPFDNFTPAGVASLTPGILTLGFKYVSPEISAAVAAARKASVAVVFVGDFTSEAYDRPSLALSGDEDALISAVAAANPRTVVVLNTGGAVLMPWLGKVAGVVEDWYPGEMDGSAIAAVLFGDVDPSGRLPITFPVSQAQSAIHTLAQWPGINLTSYYTEGLEVGYRYNNANGITPLFPFGFGLSYTHFSIGDLRVSRSPGTVTLNVRVTNTGTRSGTDVPQAYLTYPASAGEPPAQLVAFYPVSLAPNQSKTVSLAVPASAFQAFLGGTWTTVPGQYRLAVGESSSDLPLSTAMTAPQP